MEISFSFNSTTDDHIATTFGTCHDSTAVVPCAKYCSDHFISIWMRAKWNFHHIWNVMEKLLVKWAPAQHTTHPHHSSLERWMSSMFVSARADSSIKTAYILKITSHARCCVAAKTSATTQSRFNTNSGYQCYSRQNLKKLQRSIWPDPHNESRQKKNMKKCTTSYKD